MKVKRYANVVASACLTIGLLLGIQTVKASNCGGTIQVTIPGSTQAPQNTDPKDGTPYETPSDHDSTHHSDGTNKVGFEYLKIGSKSSDNWDEDVTWREDQIPEDKDFRVKLKKKNGKWPSEKACARIWFSHNKYFHLGGEDWAISDWECDRFDDSKDKESIYVEDVDIPDHIRGDRNYYFFAEVRTDDRSNAELLDVSSRTDDEEYVKLDVNHHNLDTATSITHNAPNGLEPGQAFNVTVTVHNLRDEETNSDASVDLKIWFLGYEQTVNMGRMAANSVATRIFTLVASSTPGNHEIVALSDPNNRIHETDRNNNRSTRTVTVTEPPKLYDLDTIATWIDGAYTIEGGSDLLVRGVIQSLRDSIPSDATATATLVGEDGAQYPLGSVTIPASNLPSGWSADVSISGAAPSQEGVYTLKLCASASFQETDTANNCLEEDGPTIIGPTKAPASSAALYIIHQQKAYY